MSKPVNWQRIRVSNCGTYHLVDGRPLYSRRFDRVLTYHECGLAPVSKAGAAWHIDVNGDDAYTRRFLETFGFYEGRAAVVSHDGWHHIRTDGSHLYNKRYAWCGNYQEMHCAVRDQEGCSYHILPDGEPAYGGRWRYVGDYRAGIAVVQGNNGKSTHIDISGKLVHGIWFFDLDVFHKGFARARDERGWTHVDRCGQAAYTRRFAAVEPFYNGHARVERLDGALEVIDEKGRTMIELRPAIRSEFAALSSDLVGFWRTRAIGAAVELGVFEAFPGTAAKISESCNLDPKRGYRFLRALRELGLVDMEEGIWQATHRGSFLQRKHPMTLADAAIEYADYFTRMWDPLPAALKGSGMWNTPDIFRQVAADPERVRSHHRMLRSYARHDYGDIPELLGLGGKEVVIDAGGGVGVLAKMLIKRYPQVSMILLDLPEVVQLVKSSANPVRRLNVKAADILQPWNVRGDAVILARVLHDWDDAIAKKILTHARGSLKKGGRLFVIEMLLPESGYAGGLCDLHLLMATGGQERTLEEYESLMFKCGFDMKRTCKSAALPTLIEGIAR